MVPSLRQPIMDVTSVEFSKHALEKIRSRRVLQSDVLEAIRNPESLFDDVESDTRVAISWRSSSL